MLLPGPKFKSMAYTTSLEHLMSVVYDAVMSMAHITAEGHADVCGPCCHTKPCCCQWPSAT